LTPEERAHAIVFADNYGQAGALELLGEPLGLPPVYCGHNTYFFWGPPSADTRIMASIGADAEDLAEDFDQVEESGIVHTCDGCMDYESGLPILISRGPKQPIRVLWLKARFFI